MNKILTIAYIGAILLMGGCGSSSSSSDKKDINITDYLPRTNQTKDFIMSKNGHLSSYVENVIVDSNKITIKVDDKISRIYIINEANITLEDKENNTTLSLNKYIDVGDTLYAIPTLKKVEDIKSDDNTPLGTRSLEVTQYCKLDSKLKEFQHDNFAKYTGDILKFKCTKDEKRVTTIENTIINSEIYDISYFYMEKDKGLIASINDDCLVKNAQGQEVIDDRLPETECITKNYTYILYSE